MAELTDLSKIPLKEKIPQKAIGLWAIPKLNVNVPVFKDTHDIWRNQKIVDDENSALYIPYCQAYMIQDHAGSSKTWFMEKVTLDTDAFFVRPTGTTHYRCYRLARADYHTWGYTINGSMVIPSSSKDIVCVSCVDRSGKEVYMAIFKEAGKL